MVLPQHYIRYYQLSWFSYFYCSYVSLLKSGVWTFILKAIVIFYSSLFGRLNADSFWIGSLTVFVFGGFVSSMLWRRGGGKCCNISSLSVINFHILGLLEICLSLNVNASLLLYYIMHFYLWGRASKLRRPPTCLALVHSLRSINWLWFQLHHIEMQHQFNKVLDPWSCDACNSTCIH